MKKLLLAMLALTIFGTNINTAQAAKEKKKKEIKWEWDGTKSGNKIIDDYLVCIDTTYRNIQQYKEQMDSYQFIDTTLYINGKYYAAAYMLNSQGQLVTRGQVNWQCVEAVMKGVNLVLDITTAQLATATATMELPNLGLNALKFGKYVKGGAVVFVQGIKEVKTIRGKWLANSKTWKSLKNGAIEDPASLNYFDAETLKKINKCIYIKEIQADEPEYQEQIQKLKAKDDETLKAESKAWGEEIAKSTMAPEDTKKILDDLNDSELEKAMQDEGA